VHQALRIGLAGFGNIGTAFVRFLQEQHDRIDARYAMPLELRWVCTRNPKRRRSVAPPPTAKRSSDFLDIVRDPDVDVVVELIGGVNDARTFVTAALEAGKDVITANKALLAECGPELALLAQAKGVRLLFEAAVGAGIPIIRSIETGLLSNRIVSLHGIINGTTNYILTRMVDRRGASFAEMLDEASRLGYAEPDPSLDVDGYDAAHKLAVLAALCFGQHVRASDIRIEGIRHVTPEDINWGTIQGLSLKLLASARLRDDGKLHLSVAPSYIPEAHPLAAVRGVTNGIAIEAEPCGVVFLSGAGAGGGSTVTGLMSDLADIAAQRAAGGRGGKALLSLAAGSRGKIARAQIQPDCCLRVTHPEVPLHVNRLERRLKGECVERGASDATYLIPEMKSSAMERALGTLDDLGLDSGRRSKVDFALGSRNLVDADFKK